VLDNEEGILPIRGVAWRIIRTKREKYLSASHPLTTLVVTPHPPRKIGYAVETVEKVGQKR
jgi:hypothetical protein